MICKFEARNTKHETNPNDQNSKQDKDVWKIRISNLFRISPPAIGQGYSNFGFNDNLG